MGSPYPSQPLAGRDKLEIIVVDPPHFLAGVERQPLGSPGEANQRKKWHDLPVFKERQRIAMGVPDGDRPDYIIQILRPREAIRPRQCGAV